MYKKMKVYKSILLITIIVIFLSLVLSGNILAQASDEKEVNLVLDSLAYNDILTKHFRKVSDLTGIKEGGI